MTNKEAMEILTQIKNTSQITWSNRSDVALDLAIKALKKDKCSTCEHYDKDYGETCLNPSGTCRVFEYDGYEEKENAPTVEPRIEYGIDGQAYRLFISSPTEVVKVGEPLSNSDEISKALEKGDIYKRGFEDGYLKGKEERPQGEWIDTGDKQEYWSEEYQCSLCGAKDHWHNFCPNCGADMRKEDN